MSRRFHHKQRTEACTFLRSWSQKEPKSEAGQGFSERNFHPVPPGRAGHREDLRRPAAQGQPGGLVPVPREGGHPDERHAPHPRVPRAHAAADRPGGPGLGRGLDDRHQVSILLLSSWSVYFLFSILVRCAQTHAGYPRGQCWDEARTIAIKSVPCFHM
jgi:hypothetical protein